MIYKFLSLLFLCGVCVSVFGQELQSPQINQNAIFANPGLAGSKGRTRICAELGTMDLFNINNHKLNGFNGLVSADGLLFNKSIGVGGYLSYNSFSNNKYDWYTRQLKYTGPTTDTIKSSDYSYGNLAYSNIETGIMVAPKFYLTSDMTKKNNRCISPSISIGMRANNVNLCSILQGDTLLIADKKYSTVELSHITAGLLYNTAKGYIGIKQTLSHVYDGGFSHKTSFVFAYTFSNKKVAKPNFAFNPQFYFGFLYFRHNMNVDKTHPYRPNWENDFSINLDFRYKSIIWGIYNYHSNWVYSNAGFTIGMQLKSARIVLNAAPEFLRRNGSAYYLSVNFILKKKQNTYR